MPRPRTIFNGLISLNAAITARCYRMFSDFMLAHLHSAEASPRAQLLGICEGYLAFARAHAPLFQILFQPKPEGMERVNPDILEELNVESNQRLYDFARRLRPLCAGWRA